MKSIPEGDDGAIQLTGHRRDDYNGRSMKKPFSRFESIAQRLIEGSFSRLFGGRLDMVDISAEISRIVDLERKDGTIPNQYQVELCPEDYRFWRQKAPTIEADLADFVVQLARRSGDKLVSLPHVELVANTSLGRNQVQARAAHIEKMDESTQIYARVDKPLAGAELLALDAFRILNGKQHIPLNKPQISLGRRIDNDVVIESASVSRRHAQLRWRFGRFVVYDMNSRAGTLVNGQPISECILQAGDIIQLSEVACIYGEGLTESTARASRQEPRREETQVYFRKVADDVEEA